MCAHTEMPVPETGTDSLAMLTWQSSPHSEDYASRRARVVDRAVEVGPDGVVVVPGPDLVWLIEYQPTAITERLPLLVLSPGTPPALLVPAVTDIGGMRLNNSDRHLRVVS